MKKYNSIGFIIPTYNESPNISTLIDSIQKHTPGARIFIIDDSGKNENKKIKEIIRKKQNVKITLISRNQKLGRGSAVIAGFKEAIKDKKLLRFFEMDSDLSHDPKEANKFISQAVKENADLVIGSRYLSESRIIKWKKWRIIMSKLINVFLYLLLNLKITDYTDGYRLYTRRAIMFLTKTPLESKGFILLSETAYKLKLRGFKISEVPISFTERKLGSSTLGNQELLSSLINILLMRAKYIRFFQVIYLNRLKIMFLLLVVLFALILRVWNLNQMGRTWDEDAYIEQGYQVTELLRKGDLTNPFYSKFTFDHPPMARYLYGVASHFDIGSFSENGQPNFNYDYTYSRLVSVIFSILSIALVFLIGWEYISPFVGVASGVIMSMLPNFLGYSQIATLESLVVFFFTASVYSFLKLINQITYKKILITGIITGLCLGVKQSNVLIFPLFLGICILWLRRDKQNLKQIKKIAITLTSIFIISGIVFSLFWPMPLLDLKTAFEVEKTMWFSNVKLPPPEVFYGRLLLNPIFYYPVMFAITIPVLIIALFFIGMKAIDIKKRFILYAILFWFILPFFQSFYPFRQQGLRLIIQVVAPLSIIAAIGIEFLTDKISKEFRIKVFSLVILIIYLFSILIPISPYYLNYFNILVGGVNNVYEKKLFQIGWWGEGMREAGEYLKSNASNGSTIGLAISPIKTFPKINKLKLMEYSNTRKFDYVVVNNYYTLREGFDDSFIKENYKLVYQVLVDKAAIVEVYSK